MSWQDDILESRSSSVLLVELNSDETATILKAKVLIAYPVHVLVLNFSPCCHNLLSINGPIMTGFLPVANVERRECFVGYDVISIHSSSSGSNVEVGSFVPLTPDASGRFQKMEALHKAHNMVLEQLNCYTLNESPTSWKHGITGTCFLSVVSYCCDKPKAKVLPCISHGIRVQGPCAKCLVELNDIKDLITRQIKTGTDTKELTNRMEDIFASLKGLEHLDYLGEEVAVKDRI